MGGLWPRVVLFVEGGPSPSTLLSVAAVSASDDPFEGAHGFTYRRGLDQALASTLLRGLASGLGPHTGLTLHVVDIGSAADTAEAVCRRAAHLVALLFVSRLSKTGQDLEVVLEAATQVWGEA